MEMSKQPAVVPPVSAGTTGAGAPRETIEMIDLTSGRSTSRGPEALTLDVPPDLDPAMGAVSVDADGLAYYTSARGTPQVAAARLTPLVSRESGKECLVGDEEIEAGGTFAVRRYRRCRVGSATPS